MDIKKLLSAVPRTRGEYLAFSIDVFMLVLILLDLLWLIFDALFGVQYLREALSQIMPDFTNFYGTIIHPNFLFFDSFVVLIFVIEFAFRWLFSVLRREHSHWFFYPIVHWYDVLGCLPMGSFRTLRLFRVAVLMLRLHKWRVIDIRSFSIVRFGIKYYNIAVEEVADRVAVRILEETKSELVRGRHLVDEIIDVVIRPRKQELINFATEQVQISIKTHYLEQRKEVKRYLKQIVRTAVETNKEVANLEKIPMLGQYLKDSLRLAVSDITFAVLDTVVQDVSHSPQAAMPRMVVQGLFDIILAERQPMRPSLAAEIVNHAIDTIIERVDIKQWKIEMDEIQAVAAKKAETESAENEESEK